MATLALIAFAPLVLVPGASDVGPLPGAPNASREVARFTAPPVRPSQGRTRPASGETAGPQTGGGASLAAASGLASGVAGETASKTGRGPLLRGSGSLGGRPSQPTAEQPGKAKKHGEAEGEGNGKAKGHHKAKHHGKAKGHSKAKHHGRIAFASARAGKSGHVHSSRSSNHAGRRARAHARARR